jgi:hypothetical protein
LGRDGEERTLVGFSISNEGCNVVRCKECIAENAWRWEAMAGLLTMITIQEMVRTNGSVAIDSEHRDICSK